MPTFGQAEIDQQHENERRQRAKYIGEQHDERAYRRDAKRARDGEEKSEQRYR